MNIGYDAKRIVRNGTGLGSYGRTLINSISAVDTDDMLSLYAPDEGRDDLRSQIILRPNVSFHYPDHIKNGFKRTLWRSHGIVKDLVRDHVDLYHGLSGELPIGIHKAGIPTVVTIHDLIFLRHPEYYNWIDVQIYKWKFLQTLKEADHIIAISECTKRDILYYSDYPEDKISVIYQSAARRFTNNTKEENTDSQRFRRPLHPSGRNHRGAEERLGECSSTRRPSEGYSPRARGASDRLHGADPALCASACLRVTAAYPQWRERRRPAGALSPCLLLRLPLAL